jgi:hypothetical protein
MIVWTLGLMRAAEAAAWREGSEDQQGGSLKRFGLFGESRFWGKSEERTDMASGLPRVNHLPLVDDDQLAALLPPSRLILGNPMADIRLHRRDLRPGFRL